MDWKECNEKRLVKKIMADFDLINSLSESSNKKYKSASLLTLNDITYSSVISLYYDSLREILEAITIGKGYKIYNHECYGCFLKELLQLKELAEDFDSARKIRNGMNYYGQKISLPEARIVIADMKKLIEKCRGML